MPDPEDPDRPFRPFPVDVDVSPIHRPGGPGGDLDPSEMPHKVRDRLGIALKGIEEALAGLAGGQERAAATAAELRGVVDRQQARIEQQQVLIAQQQEVLEQQRALLQIVAQNQEILSRMIEQCVGSAIDKVNQILADENLVGAGVRDIPTTAQRQDLSLELLPRR